MFFTLSKIFWALAQPTNFLILLLVIGAVLLWRAPRVGRIFTIAVVVIIAVLSIIPIGEYLLHPIEDTYAIPVLPGRVDGVIVLGGFVLAENSTAHQQIQMNEKAERLTEFVALAHRYPHAKLVFSGGSGSLSKQQSREADWVRRAWTDMGLDPARVIWERDSRNTYENVVNSKVLARPRAGETWVLVTSAVHMPRAVAIFARQGWRVIPYPVDFITANIPFWQREFSVTRNLWLLNEAMKEIMGRAAYQFSGKAD